MKCADEFRSREITAPLVAEIHREAFRPVRIMEVCGTHTMAIFRHGMRSLLPDTVELLSGPGCPVCVTPAGHIDAFVAAARRPEVTVATFGDLIRVPGSDARSPTPGPPAPRGDRLLAHGRAHARGPRTRRTVVFPAVGFETTAPTIAATILQAKRQGLDNFLVIPANKTMPRALEALLDDPQLQVDGLLCPGHVSAIIGAEAYRPLAERYHLACAVAGFEPADILAGLLSLVRQVNAARATVDNCYSRVVTAEGNLRAQQLMATVFAPVDSEWRGLGTIPASGLALGEGYRRFDAMEVLDLPLSTARDPHGCRCGEILKGRLLPPDCPLYGGACTPLHPVGPCMVSGEGTCAAYHRYSDLKTSRRTAAAGQSTVRPYQGHP